MGFLKKLFGIGATAAATVAAVRVSDKYKENNPDGVGDLNGDGVVDAKDVLIGVKNAAKDVYNDAKSAVKEQSPQTYAFDENVVDEVKETAAEVKAEVQEVFADVKEDVLDIKEEAEETVAEIREEAEEVFADGKEEESVPSESAQEPAPEIGNV